MGQHQKNIHGSKMLRTHKLNKKFSKSVNSTNVPKPSDIQKIIKKVIRKEGD